MDTSALWFKTCDIWSQLVAYTSNQFIGDVASSEEKIVFNSVLDCIDTCLFFDNGITFLYNKLSYNFPLLFILRLVSG